MKRFNYYFKDGKKGYLEILEVSKDKYIKLTINLKKDNEFIYKNHKCSIGWHYNKGFKCLVIILELGKYIKIGKRQDIIEYIWKENGKGFHSQIYGYTKECKTNWGD